SRALCPGFAAGVGTGAAGASCAAGTATSAARAIRAAASGARRSGLRDCIDIVGILLLGGGLRGGLFGRHDHTGVTASSCDPGAADGGVIVERGPLRLLD